MHPIQPVTDMEFAFGANRLADLVPAEQDVPQSFASASNVWHAMAKRILLRGISLDYALEPRTGVDALAALRHVGAILQAADCSDDRKVAAVGFLLHNWFVWIRVGKQWAREV